MSFSDGCSNSEAKLVLRPIVSLTETLPKKVLEPIVKRARSAKLAHSLAGEPIGQAPW